MSPPRVLFVYWAASADSKFVVLGAKRTTTPPLNSGCLTADEISSKISPSVLSPFDPSKGAGNEKNVAFPFVGISSGKFWLPISFENSLKIPSNVSEQNRQSFVSVKTDKKYFFLVRVCQKRSPP